MYDGYVQEIYPPRISAAYRVERLYLDSGPVETIYGNVKTYFRNTNGTWQTGGRNYMYRHVLTGPMPAGNQDTTFVYLSNLAHITFEQACKAAGFSSNKADYFAVEDAVLVEWSDVIPGGSIEITLSMDPALDTAITNAILKQHEDTVPDGYLVTESYILVSLESIRLGESNDLNAIFAHIYYLHQLFDVSNNYPVEHNRIFQEAQILFEVDENGNYIQRTFFRPQNAAEYVGDLSQYFVFGNEKIAKYQQQYAAHLLKNCWESATAYIENRNAGQSITESVYGDVIDRIIYDIDTDGKDEICTLVYVKTNGVFSFCFDISSAEENSTYIKYRQSYILRRYDSLSFDLAENGQLRIRAERNIDSNDVVYFDITLKDGDILLHCDEEGIFLT